MLQQQQNTEWYVVSPPWFSGITCLFAAVGLFTYPAAGVVLFTPPAYNAVILGCSTYGTRFEHRWQQTQHARSRHRRCDRCQVFEMYVSGSTRYAPGQFLRWQGPTVIQGAHGFAKRAHSAALDGDAIV